VTEVDAKGATLRLEDGVEGYLRASEISRDRVEDARVHLNLNDSIEAKIIGVDRKTRSILLSIKAKETQEEQDVMREINRAEPGSQTLGDLFKEQIDSREN